MKLDECFSIHPDNRIEPEANRQKVDQDDIEGVELPDMYPLVNHHFLFFVRGQLVCPSNENKVEERKGRLPFFRFVNEAGIPSVFSRSQTEITNPHKPNDK